MKKLLLAFALLIGTTSFYGIAEAQNINISINIGRQPAWGPVGYDYVGYYYFPDIDCYYDVNLSMFYYRDRGHWISARYLPHAYSHYDLYRIHKVVLNVREPWRYHHTHYRDYARYKGHRGQIVIRDSRDVRYRDSRNNRVAWYYSDNRNGHHKNNHNYKNNKNNNNNNNGRRDNYYSGSNSHNNNYRKEANKNNPRNDNKNYNKSDRNKNNNRPEVNKNNRSDRNKATGGNNNYNSSRSQDKDKAKDSQAKRPSTRQSTGYHLTSAPNSGNGRGR